MKLFEINYNKFEMIIIKNYRCHMDVDTSNEYRTTRIKTCQNKGARSALGPSPGGPTERSGCADALPLGVKMDLHS